MAFQRGDKVEVCNTLDGYMGSYYEATIVANMGNNYVVQYKNLVEEFNHIVLLKETVKAEEVRPVLPEIREANAGFQVADRVDAKDRDGWWINEVISQDNRSGYQFVFFERYTKEEIDYPVSELRVHQEWRDGKWVSSRVHQTKKKKKKNGFVE